MKQILTFFALALFAVASVAAEKQPNILFCISVTTPPDTMAVAVASIPSP